MTERFMQTYLMDRWFISTALRDADIPGAPGLRYYETLIWEWDPETKRRGDMIPLPIESRGPLGHGSAIQEHEAICKVLVDSTIMQQRGPGADGEE